MGETLLDRTRATIERWRDWQRVKAWQMPEHRDKGERCPLCGSEMVRVTTPVPRYPHDPPVPEDHDPPSPVLEMVRCGGCERYQHGQLAGRKP